MTTIKVFARLNWSYVRVYPYTEEAKTFLFDRWVWPDVIKMFLGKKISLTPQECVKLEKEGVCKFVQCIDPMLKVEGIADEAQEVKDNWEHCPGCDCD